MNEKLETNGLIQTEPVSQFSDRTIDPISAEMSDGDNIKQYSSIPTVQAKSAPGMAAKEADDKLTVETSYNGRIRPGIVVVAIALLLVSTPTISMLVGMITSIAFRGASYAYWLSGGNWLDFAAYLISIVAFMSAIGLLLRYKWSLAASVISMAAYVTMNAYFLLSALLESGLLSEMSYTPLGALLFYLIYIIIHVASVVYLLRPRVRAMFY